MILKKTLSDVSQTGASNRLVGFRPFSDRLSAGRELAKKLVKFRGRSLVVVALPRGGIPVGFEVARALACPLDMVLVRKIGAPGQPELAMGAVVGTDPPVVILNEDVRKYFAASSSYVESEKAAALEEIERRRSLWGAGALGSYRECVVILVDDGLATGTSAEAAVAALRQKEPAGIVLAVPVAPVESIERLSEMVDEVVCLQEPDPFFGVGAYYEDFHQLSDSEVSSYLIASRPVGD